MGKCSADKWPPRSPITASTELVFNPICWGADPREGQRGLKVTQQVRQVLVPPSFPFSMAPAPPMSLLTFLLPPPAPPSRDHRVQRPSSNGLDPRVSHPTGASSISALTTSTAEIPPSPCVCVRACACACRGRGAGKKLITPLLHSSWLSQIYQELAVPSILQEGKLRINKWPKTRVAEPEGWRDLREQVCLQPRSPSGAGTSSLATRAKELARHRLHTTREDVHTSSQLAGANQSQVF